MRFRNVSKGWGVGVATLVALALWVAPASAAPVLRQVSDFEAGTAQGWTNGDRPGAPDPVNITTGGPLGASDNFLRVTSHGGSGPGSRLTVFNRGSAWTGNYTTARVSLVEMDLKNFGAAPLVMRLGLQESAGTRFASTTPFNLPADGLWHHAVFGVDATSLTRAGSTPVATALTRVSELRVIHSVGADFQGDPVSSSVGVDNIRALPEPGGIAAASVGFGLLLARRRRR